MKQYPEQLKLENQLCFPLYVASKEIIRQYQPLLNRFHLTYTQYIVLLCLWEYGTQSVKQIGERLYLDSGTLTPLLKKLEAQKLIKRRAGSNDERVTIVSLTKAGEDLRQQAEQVPLQIAQCVDLQKDEAQVLYKLLYQIIGGFQHE